MILYITSDSKKEMLEFLTKDKNEVIKKYVGSFNVNKLLFKSIKNINIYKYVFIDEDAIEDEIESISDTIETFNILFSSNIIFYSKDETLINILLKNNIFNILTEEKRDKVKEEIEIVMSKEGMTEEYIKRKLGIFNEEVIEDIKEETVDFEINKTINIIGAQERTGATRIAMNICSYLSSLKASVCYVEVNQSNHLKYILKELEGENKGIYNEEKTIYTYKNIDFINYKNYKDKKEEYNYIICDFGAINDNIIEVLEDDEILLIANNNCYEIENIIKAKNLLEDKKYNIIYNLSIESKDKNGYYYKYSKNIWDFNGNQKTLKEMLK